jgi:kumamolisin
MAFERRVSLHRSGKKALRGARAVGAVPDDETVRVTILLRRRAEPKTAPESGGFKSMTHEQFAQFHGAEPKDLALVNAFAQAFQLKVVESHARKRRVVLTGTAATMSRAFGTSLQKYVVEGTGQAFRGRTGVLTIPSELQDIVEAVMGLDTRSAVQPHFRIHDASAAAVGFTPQQIGSFYNFPTGVNGTGQTIGILEFGGGYNASDLETYFNKLNIPVPNLASVSVDEGQNLPGSSVDVEVMLDIEVAGTIANGSNIAVYFGPNTDQGFVDAILDAVHDTTRNPSVISISWGGQEDSWTQQALSAINSALQDAAMLGITVAISSGDRGSADGETDGQLHVDFPASSPYALACGGTSLTVSGNAISSEVVWNDGAGSTGGGVSTFFALPTYQTSAGVPSQPQTGFVGRGVPDVAGNADPFTGYQVRVDGQDILIGGTSAVAPLWAALVALINQKLGKSVGYINPSLYAIAQPAFQDVIQGDNDSSTLGSYAADPGWDPCTGLGSPNGGALLSALQSSPAD